jgi:hypothetical protein
MSLSIPGSGLIGYPQSDLHTPTGKLLRREVLSDLLYRARLDRHVRGAPAIERPAARP